MTSRFEPKTVDMARFACAAQGASVGIDSFKKRQWCTVKEGGSGTPKPASGANGATSRRASPCATELQMQLLELESLWALNCHQSSLPNGRLKAGEVLQETDSSLWHFGVRCNTRMKLLGCNITQYGKLGDLGPPFRPQPPRQR